MTENYKKFVTKLTENISMEELVKFDDGYEAFFNEVIHDIVRDLRTEKKCPVCDGQLYCSDRSVYDYVCVSCDEYFFDDEAEEDMETCPVCGAEIEVYDGEDNGYGELHMYWTCDVCGSSGKAIIDQHNDNAFIGHEID
jgi:DnaJ-class molecular chaperone